MTRADTIARHINATTLGATDKRLLNAAFLECLGGAAVAGEAAGKAPPPPKPAGWVVRHSGGPLRWLCRGPAGYEPYATREDAQRIADTTGGEPVPVDAAGNVIEAAGEAAGPWVVRVTVRGSTRWHSRTGPAESFLHDGSTYDTRAEADAAAAEWGTDYAATVLPLAEAEREEAAAVLASLPAFAQQVLAGNVIEAEDIGATLRREECERKAARQSGVAWEAARAGEEAERLRGELAAVRVERDALNAAEADLRHALRQIAGMVGVAVALGASTEMHCAVADEVRAVVGQLRAEVQRSREQKPVRWGFLDEAGVVVCTTSVPEPVSAVYRVAPLYLAPVVRDHSEVIAQCEEALRESSGLVIATDVMRPALRAALSALRGAS